MPASLKEITWFFVNAMGIQIAFGKNSQYVLHQQTGRDTIWGYPAKQIGFHKPDFQYCNSIFAVYEVDFSQPQGKELPGSTLRIQGCVSCNSLQDASIYDIAFASTGAVSRCVSTYWVSDKNDVSNWKHRLLQMEEYLSMPIIE